ncbi:hypothetical protein LEP1GSC047_0098 [Leptospira inadai serovar Lyme str. 10]|uniref:Uncharacterized protein n=1 Tax=Leptospira inadai serovar Lyme str. 10 TaxID=1049790 RepID=V6HFW5_9LEPT|nr:hypothetical protein LEP1GSC047_0098 [Leptospira inadai serovar Lyme str. 10]
MKFRPEAKQKQGSPFFPAPARGSYGNDRRRRRRLKNLAAEEPEGPALSKDSIIKALDLCRRTFPE